MTYRKLFTVVVAFISFWHISFWVKKKVKCTFDEHRQEKEIAENSVKMLISENTEKRIAISKLERQFEQLENAIKMRLY